MSTYRPAALPGERGIGAPASKYEAVCAPSNAWPTGWPAVWSTARLWRADVFAVSEAWRDGRATERQLLGAVLTWGHGDNGYGPTRTARSLATPELDRRLAEALAPLKVNRPSLEALLESYRALRSPAASKISWMRASFFTKLLYFAGYRRGAGGVQPLILDSVVAGRLPEGLVQRPSLQAPFPNWRSTEWRAFLDWAGTEAEQQGIEPEQIELQLFNGA